MSYQTATCTTCNSCDRLSGMTQIAILVENSRAYGRALIEGVASYAQENCSWLLRPSPSPRPARPTSEICYACGFSSPQYFCRTFAAAYGMSPKTFRERAKSLTNTTPASSAARK